MNDQIIFFFSALGAFNGLLLSVYFALSKKKQFSNYFLSLLLLTISIRIIKSIFFYYNPDLANIFIQIGLSACLLIGPLLYLYLRCHNTQKTNGWMINTIPFLIIITVLGIMFPFDESLSVWRNYILRGIYLVWLSYMIYSFRYVKPSFQKLLKRTEPTKNTDIWLVSIYLGVGLIWLAYVTCSFTSYIVGALSFSFALYLIVLLFIFRNQKNTSFFEEKERYKNKSLDSTTLSLLKQKVSEIKEKELYLQNGFTLSSAADQLKVSKHNLSHYLNEKIGKSFSVFVSELRIEKAKELLSSPSPYTIESIGYECGFNSKSTFFTTFKKITGQTPSDFKKSHEK